ncbi:DUF1036 domain-containing protein [Aureimonas leprariae]|uniref:DUF1036 domain-containing protein n=1 Tax=Plantimonas leprariae TaxID=2615207 RepID=A0A7V7TVY7_9HYPH|nr:DUF1036 domain-containing protein [Aureimonas leprariae]KAB0678759.1 DUF1036 domain-containing protein [Aureimonas leprariae]
MLPRPLEGWRRAGAPLALAVLGFLFAAPFTSGAARADFRVCNGTQSLVGVAVGYRAEAGWTAEGWWQIPATTCKSVIEGPLSSRYYYLYAEDQDGRGLWAGGVNFCVAEKEFKIAGVKDCFARGFQKLGFREYDTGEQGSWMVQLTEAPRGDATTP